MGLESLYEKLNGLVALSYINSGRLRLPYGDVYVVCLVLSTQRSLATSHWILAFKMINNT